MKKKLVIIYSKNLLHNLYFCHLQTLARELRINFIFLNFFFHIQSLSANFYLVDNCPKHYPFLISFFFLFFNENENWNQGRKTCFFHHSFVWIPVTGRLNDFVVLTIWGFSKRTKAPDARPDDWLDWTADIRETMKLQTCMQSMMGRIQMEKSNHFAVGGGWLHPFRQAKSWNYGILSMEEDSILYWRRKVWMLDILCYQPQASVAINTILVVICNI